MNFQNLCDLYDVNARQVFEFNCLADLAVILSS